MAKRKKITVKPFIPENYSFLGLENYKMVLYDNCIQREDLGYIEINGIKRYLTGLDEHAPSITSITNEAIKQEKIKEIREVVAELEMKLVYNYIDPKDPDFWSKVKVLLPTNYEFWSKVKITLDNNGLVLDIDKNPHDKILYYCIKAGGFSLVAPSYKVAVANNPKYYFYLDSEEETLAIDVTIRKVKNKAFSILDNIEDTKNHKKLLYLVKILLPNGHEYSLDYSISDLYSVLDEYISNTTVNNDNAYHFIKNAEMKDEEIVVKALVSDLVKMKKIYYKDLDRQYYCVYTNSLLGKNLDEITSYLLLETNRVLLNAILERYRADITTYGIKSEIEIMKEKIEDEVLNKESVAVDDSNNNDEGEPLIKRGRGYKKI